MTRPVTKATQLTRPEAVAYHAAIKALIRRAKAYAKRKKLTAQQVSKRLFGNVERIDDIEKRGSFILPDTFEAACRKLDALEREEAEAAA